MKLFIFYFKNFLRKEILGGRGFMCEAKWNPLCGSLSNGSIFVPRYFINHTISPRATIAWCLPGKQNVFPSEFCGAQQVAKWGVVRDTVRVREFHYSPAGNWDIPAAWCHPRGTTRIPPCSLPARDVSSLSSVSPREGISIKKLLTMPGWKVFASF